MYAIIVCFFNATQLIIFNFNTDLVFFFLIISLSVDTHFYLFSHHRNLIALIANNKNDEQTKQHLLRLLQVDAVRFSSIHFSTFHGIGLNEKTIENRRTKPKVRVRVSSLRHSHLCLSQNATWINVNVIHYHRNSSSHVNFWWAIVKC